MIEDVPQEKAEGGKAKVYTAFIGWQSVQHHLDFRGHEEFKANIHLLRQAKDLVAMEVYHAKFLEVQGPGPLSGEERGADALNVQEEVLNPQDAPKNPPKTGSQ